MGILVAVSLAIGLVLLVMPSRGQRRHRPFMALRRDAVTMIKRGQLPDPDRLRSKIKEAAFFIGTAGLDAGTNRLAAPNGPRRPTLEAVTADVFRQTNTLWGFDQRKDAGYSLRQIAELACVFDVIYRPEDEAATAIDRFRDAGAARALRAQADRIRADQARFDDEDKAYRQAIAAWEKTGKIARYHKDRDLAGLLRDMSPSDPDLWHAIALESDLGDPRDEAGLFWAFAQPDCDRASVAAFLMRYASLGYLSAQVAAEHRKGRSDFADAIAGVVDRWNTGFYQSQTFAFDPDAVSLGTPKAMARAFADQTAKAARVLGRQPWGDPEGLFRTFKGREIAPTLFFRHGHGLMTLPPKPQDFISAEFFTDPWA